MKKRFIMLILFVVAFIIVLNADFLESKSRNVVTGAAVNNATIGYPVLLLHGFNPTYSPRIAEFSLKDLQGELASDGFVDKGIFLVENNCDQLRASGPIVVRTSYLERLKVSDIQEYAQNVNRSISRIQECTGAEKVDIIAHSMGGIVVRYYLQNIDDSSVRKFVMLGTPNRGGLYNVGELADRKSVV